MNNDAVREPAEGPQEKEGDILGTYQLVRLLGEGSMGRVFLAKHTRLGREVALKILKPEHVRNHSLVQRFFQEARTVNQINHEHIVEVLDFVEEPPDTGYGRVYCVMERLQGLSLSEMLRKEPLPIVRGARIVRQVCAALEAAHRVGVVHRDVKPDNIFIVERTNQTDYVKMLDFGVAKLTAPMSEEKASSTLEGTIIGTPSYMAPEQAAGLETNFWTDIYGVGAVLYEMLAGKPPFEGDVFGHLMVQIITQPPRSLPSHTPGKEKIPSALKTLVMRCLEKEPSDRPRSMADLGELLGELAAGRKLRIPGSRGRWGYWAVGSAAAAMVLTAAIASVRFGPRGKPDEGSGSSALNAAATPLSQQVNLSVSSVPPGARVVRLDTGGALGVTPLNQKISRVDQPVMLRVELDGFRPAELSADLSRDASIEVVLTSQSNPTTTVSTPSPPRKKAKKRMTRDGTLDPFAN